MSNLPIYLFAEQVIAHLKLLLKISEILIPGAYFKKDSIEIKVLVENW